MANIDAAFGLRPYQMLGAGANTNGVTATDRDWETRLPIIFKRH